MNDAKWCVRQRRRDWRVGEGEETRRGKRGIGQEKVDRLRSFISKRLTDAGAVKNDS